MLSVALGPGTLPMAVLLALPCEPEFIHKPGFYTRFLGIIFYCSQNTATTQHVRTRQT